MNLPGGNQLPYRLPCEGSVICSNGPRYQHARASEKNIPVFIYHTLLPNAYIPPRGDLIPYERWNDLSSGPNCAPDHCDGGVPAPCEGWIGPGASQFNLSNTVPTPTFYQPHMLTGVTLANAGSNYHLGDILSVTGGTASTFIAFDPSYAGATAQIAVGTVNANTGAIETFSIAAPGSYQTPPSSPDSPSGGHGNGASFNLIFGNQTENISPCFKYGYKNVQAMRRWHGTPGYFFNGQPNVYACTDPIYGSDCKAVDYIEYSLSAPQTKYCNVSYEITGSFYQFTGSCSSETGLSYSPTISDTYEANISLNPDSGVITVNSGSAGCGAAAAFSNLISNQLSDWISDFVTDWITGPYGTDTATGLSCSDSGYSFSYTTGDGTEETGSGSWTFNPGTFSATHTRQDYNPGDLSGGNQTESVTVTDDSVSYSYQQQIMFEGTGIWEAIADFTMSISLGTTNTAQDVLADIYTLLNEWDLTNDAIYPWRTDSYTSIAPLVIRNEVGQNVSPLGFSPFVCTMTEINDCFGDTPADAPDYVTTYQQNLNTDTNADLCDGSIIGAPLPAGYQQYFDWYYTDWESCDETGHGDFVGYIEGWGKYNTSQNGIPRTATHWTTNDLAWQFPGGAWIFYNFNTSGVGCTEPSGTFPPGLVIIAQKWAETKMAFPSENFFRPAGDDKFVYDENHVYTISSIIGSGTGAQVTLELPFSCSTPNGSSDPLPGTSGLWGGPSIGGFFTLSSIANGQTVTLGTKVYNVPSDWKSASDTGSGESAFTFGLLRWSNGTPASDPPPILGRAHISNFAMYNGSNSVTELTTDSLPDLGMGVSNTDHIDIFDKNMTLLAANAPIMRLDDTHFTVDLELGTLANATFLMSNGAPNYGWDDQYPKGDYVYNDFYYWNRVICEADRWNTLITDCDSGNCACPNGTQTVYCFPFFNAVADNAGNFGNAFHQSANCLSFTPCEPSVLYITPNTENFAVGRKYPFPNANAVNLDEQYGSGWIAEFQQVIIDPLWQSPHFPASSIGSCNTSNNAFEWLMDDGGCQADSEGTTEYYPHAPLVEARLTVPAGAPSLPNGISLGWASPAGLTANCGSPASDVLFPPPPNGYLLSGPQPIWSIWSLECDCLAASGRFATQYQNEVIGCS